MLRPLLALVIGFSVSGCVATYQKNWVEVTTPHFVVKSEVDEAMALRLAKDLERFRRVVALSTNADDSNEAPIPTRIFIFDRASYAEFSPGHRIVGYFAPGIRDNSIVMRGDQYLQSQVTIQHEYAHYVLHSRSEATYPLWYEEGFAQLLSTARTSNDVLVFGMPTLGMLGMLHASAWIPIAKLIETRALVGMNMRQTWQFYGESWALVHYLSLGRDRRSGELSQYLAALAGGSSAQVAFERAFGVKVEQLDAAVQTYVRSGMRGAEWPDGDFSAIVTPSVRPLPLEEIATDLGMLRLRRGRQPADFASAEAYFRAALEKNPTHARAYAGLGDALLAQDKLDQAEPCYQKAIEIAAQDPLSELDYGEYLSVRAVRAKTGEERHRWLVQARKHYVRAWKIDPVAPESYVQYGASFNADGEDHAKGLATLEHAAEVLPSSLEIRFALADLYLLLGRAAEARALLMSIVVWLHPDNPATKKVLARIARATEQAARDTQAGASPPPHEGDGATLQPAD